MAKLPRTRAGAFHDFDRSLLVTMFFSSRKT
jgi:hypothetical protein